MIVENGSDIDANTNIILIDNYKLNSWTVNRVLGR